MLAEINIQDFAIVDRLHLALEEGLNVLTGETGAGKSIVVDALGFVLGARAGASVVRPGAKLARVEALFEASPEVRGRLDDLGLASDDAAIVLAREITAAGRNTHRINGTLVTQAVLREVGDLLVEVHGQHESQGLMSAARHLEFLDRLGGESVQQWRAPHKVAHERWKSLRAEREALVAQQRDRERRREWLAFEAEEIEAAGLIAQPDEIEALQAERSLLANADKIRVRVEEAAALLDDGDGVQGARTLLGRVARLLSQVSAFDPAAESTAATAQGALVSIEELARDLSAYGDRVDADPRRLEQVHERLDQISRLQKKYGGTVGEILAYAARARAELGTLQTSEARQAELEADIALAGGALAELAGKLSAARREVASSLEARVASELHDLEMKGTKFAARFSWEHADDGLPVAALGDGLFQVGASGADRVEFLISANPGQPLMPLAQIASGGEMSRIMLAIQSVLAEVDPVGTLIFDEVDAGLGGIAAEAVAGRLRRIAQSRQVVCITHLPLVAAAAATHWTISKEVVDDATRSRAALLNDVQRAHEIARMMAGKQASETTVRQAQEMLGKRKRKTKV
ncbi:MAG: DNA repair protein RecN [Armatimonadetes bacterium]|nr:DNA repair protein RecN [Armatimonadota bacterium]